MESMQELKAKIEDCDQRKRKINVKWNQKRDALDKQISQCYVAAHRIEKEIKKTHGQEALEIQEINQVRSEHKKKLKPMLNPVPALEEDVDEEEVFADFDAYDEEEGNPEERGGGEDGREEEAHW